jgi:DUF1680 family protein
MDRQWQTGDVVTLNYAMSVRSEPSGPERVAFFFGPWLLGASAFDNPTYFSDLTTKNQLSTTTQHGLSAAKHSPQTLLFPWRRPAFATSPRSFQTTKKR